MLLYINLALVQRNSSKQVIRTRLEYKKTRWIFQNLLSLGSRMTARMTEINFAYMKGSNYFREWWEVFGWDVSMLRMVSVNEIQIGATRSRQDRICQVGKWYIEAINRTFLGAQKNGKSWTCSFLQRRTNNLAVETPASHSMVWRLNDWYFFLSAGYKNWLMIWTLLEKKEQKRKKEEQN